MMDKCIVVKKNRGFCIPIRDVKKGDLIVIKFGRRDLALAKQDAEVIDTID